MQKSDTLDMVTGIFRDTLDLDDLVLTPQMSAKDIEEWDSLNHILLVVAVEKKFGIKFNTGEIEGLQNVGEFVALIEKKISK